jgi:regulator of replication initiation timing
MSLSESIKGIKNLAVGMENLELISRLIDLQTQAYEILDENRELRLELERIQRMEETASDLEYLADFYYKKSDGSGPYCPVCWDVNNKLVNVPILFKSSQKWHGNCNNCGASGLKVPEQKRPNR